MEKFLTPKELKHLTGAVQAKRQVKALSLAGIGFTLRIDGKPVVTWEAVNSANGTVSGQCANKLDSFDGFNIRAVG